MTAFTVAHLALAGLCALFAAVHVAMGIAVRSEPAHRWVAASFIGCCVLALSIAGSSSAAHRSLGNPTPFILLAVLTVSVLPVVLTQTVWSVLDWPMTPTRRVLRALVGLLLLPTGMQIAWLLLHGDARADAWETARYGTLMTAIPYHLGTLLIGGIWLVEAVRALKSNRGLAWAAIAATVPAFGLSIREALISSGVVQGPTLLGVIALPLGLFGSVSLVVRYVRAMRPPKTPDDSGQQPYARLQRLGKGGMGEAWLAVRATEGGFRRWVVLKHVRVDRREAHIIERFLVEARIAARLHHPNIVSVYDLHPSDEGWSMVMEYLAGPSLWDVLTRCFERESFAPLGAVLQIIEQVCRGLECAHSHGILHRDISPDNIIVTFDGQAKLLDFGIAKEATRFDNEQPGIPAFNAQTQDGQASVVGKSQYLAPERIGGEPATVEADVFAMGLVLVQLLGAALPERGADLAGHPAPVSPHRPDLPEAVEAVVRRALAAHPKQRYRSAAALADDLKALQAGVQPLELTAWVRDLCTARYRLATRLQDLDTPDEASVSTAFAEFGATNEGAQAEVVPTAPSAQEFREPVSTTVD